VSDPAGSAAYVTQNAQPQWRTVGRFTVVPSVARARFLLPTVSRQVTAASLLAYNALRPSRVRAARRMLGTAARLGLVGLSRMPVLTVEVPSDVDSRELWLADHLADVLGYDQLYPAIGIRPPDPNHKPTLQLFDAQARPRGYAKLGWNPATRRLVQAEAAALRSLPRPQGQTDYPLAPRLLTVEEWAGQVVAVIEPLPSSVRRLPDPTRPHLAAMCAVARRGGPPAEPRPLGGSDFIRRLARRAEEATAGPDSEAGQLVRRAVTALERRDAEVTLEFGDWHGDWVPWNLGLYLDDDGVDRLVAWDWEHTGSDVPLGFDLAHQAFQSALTLAGAPAETATLAAEAALERYGPQLGLDAIRQRTVLDAYLIELWLRTWTLACGDAGWNPALHPALPRLLATRLPA